MMNRLKTLNPNATTYYNLPLSEALIDDGDGRVCLQESNTLYNVSRLCYAVPCCACFPACSLCIVCVSSCLDHL